MANENEQELENKVPEEPTEGTQEQPRNPQDGPPKSTAQRKEEAAAKEGQEPGEAGKEPEEPEEGTQENQEGQEEELDTSVWGDAGDDVANSVLSTLQNSGVKPDEAKALLWDAVEAGDPSKVDRDALVEKVGKAKATLIMAGIENVTSKNNERIAAVTKTAHEAAGGEANWTKARDWAAKNIPEEELADLRVMFDKGGRQAKFAASEIVERYNADPKNTSLNAGKEQVTPDGKSNKAVKGISRREYGEQLDKLHRSGWTQAKYNQLREARRIGKKQGL